MDLSKFISRFVKDDIGRLRHCGNYHLNEDATEMYYETTNSINPIKYQLAVKLGDGTNLANAQRMEVGVTSRYRRTSSFQDEFESLDVPLIPFNAVSSIGLNIKDAVIVERSGAEKIDMPGGGPVYRLHYMEHFSIKSLDQLDDVLKQLPELIIISKHKRKSGNVIELLPDGRIKGTKFHQGECYKFIYFKKESIRPMHFVGAILFRVNRKYFLFDVDRNELEYFRFNPFIVQLPHKVTSIAEAYESLKPQEVKDALAKGLDVKRQGEWFFIPSEFQPKESDIITRGVKRIDERISKQEKVIRQMDIFLGTLTGFSIERRTGIKYPESFRKIRNVNETRKGNEFIINKLSISKEAKQYAKNLTGIYYMEKAKLAELEKKKQELNEQGSWTKNGRLQAGDNRPNLVETLVKYKGQCYVEGEVTHTGREHHPIILSEFHIPVCNTGTTSWQITGDID